MVLVEGVRDGPAGRMVSVGINSDALGNGLSLPRTDKDDGVLPPIDSLLASLAVVLGWPPTPGDATVDAPTFLICSLTFSICRWYSHAACCNMNGNGTWNSAATSLQSRLPIAGVLAMIFQRSLSFSRSHSTCGGSSKSPLGNGSRTKRV